MDRLLVTGIDGPLGANLALHLADRCQVQGLYMHRPAVGIPLTAQASLPRGVAQILTQVEEWQPRWVIHCGPYGVPAWDAIPAVERTVDESQWVAALAAWAGTTGCRLTVLSSDALFAGPRMFHDEGAIPGNPSARAALMRQVERAVEPHGALIVRTHAYGWCNVPGTAGFAEMAYEALAAGMGVQADGLRHATPILTSDLAELLWRAHEMRLQGIYHIAGAERASPYRFVSELASVMGCDRPQAPSHTLAALTGAWHEETSLNSKRARRSLEMPTPMLREGLERFVQQRSSTWWRRWRETQSQAAEHDFAA